MDIWLRVWVNYRAHKGFYRFARRGDVFDIAYEPIGHTNSIFNGKNKVSYLIYLRSWKN